MRLPTGKWPVVLADPPWSFMTYSGGKVPQRAGIPHYQVMSLADICDLPVREHTEKDAMLFLWVLDSMIPQAITVADAWGFNRYIKVGFNWTKPNMGMGFWSRNDCELCLMFAKGKPGPRLSANVRQRIEAPASKHSEKPIGIYEGIEGLLPGPYLELFARTAHPAYPRRDWTPWGLEANGLHNAVARLEDALEALTEML